MNIFKKHLKLIIIFANYNQEKFKSYMMNYLRIFNSLKMLNNHKIFNKLNNNNKIINKHKLFIKQKIKKLTKKLIIMRLINNKLLSNRIDNLIFNRKLLEYLLYVQD